MRPSSRSTRREGSGLGRQASKGGQIEIIDLTQDSDEEDPRPRPNLRSSQAARGRVRPISPPPLSRTRSKARATTGAQPPAVASTSQQKPKFLVGESSQSSQPQGSISLGLPSQPSSNNSKTDSQVSLEMRPRPQTRARSEAKAAAENVTRKSGQPRPQSQSGSQSRCQSTSYSNARFKPQSPTTTGTHSRKGPPDILSSLTEKYDLSSTAGSSSFPQSPSKEHIVKELRGFREEMEIDHADFVNYELGKAIEDISKPQNFVFPVNPFAAMEALEPVGASETSMRIQFKQLHKASKSTSQYFPVISLSSTKEAVPAYRFHHVEVSRSIKSADFALGFDPYFKDLEDKEQQKYYDHLEELRATDKRDGYKPMSRHEKQEYFARNEQASRLNDYLDDWLDRIGSKLAIPLSRAGLVAHLFPFTEVYPGCEEPSNASVEVAKGFTEAFDIVFNDEKVWKKQAVGLEAVLQKDSLLCSLLQNTSLEKDWIETNPALEKEPWEKALDSHVRNMCIICHSYVCEHGDWSTDQDDSGSDSDSCPDDTESASRAKIPRPRPFTLDHIGQSIGQVARARKLASMEEEIAEKDDTPCSEDCFLARDTATTGAGVRNSQIRPWTELDRHLATGWFHALGNKTKTHIACLAAPFLDRPCWDVSLELKRLKLEHSLPTSQGVPLTRNQTTKKKSKKGSRRDDRSTQGIPKPCSHDGPCIKPTCGCVKAQVLCERFCLCSSSCSQRYKGCECVADKNGRCCASLRTKRKAMESNCPCFLLQRECDPSLCRCGAKERANRLNKHNKQLHNTGCQNVCLQRGVTPALVVGESQLEGVGFGLYAAEDIPKHHFVIEYVGELINATAGDKRAERSGNVFKEGKGNAISYLFTIREKEDDNPGLWVDGARYGSLSRYINHAPRKSKDCNISVYLMFVNGVTRIAMFSNRPILKGEELFFNYGEHFPNLDKKISPARSSFGAKTPSNTPRKSQEAAVLSDTGNGDDGDTWSESESDVDDMEAEIKRAEKEVERKKRQKREARGGYDSDSDEFEPPTEFSILVEPVANNPRTRSRRKRNEDGPPGPQPEQTTRMRRKGKSVPAQERQPSESERGVMTRGRQKGVPELGGLGQGMMEIDDDDDHYDELNTEENQEEHSGNEREDGDDDAGHFPSTRAGRRYLRRAHSIGDGGD